jgi:hypothetical protein
MASVSSGMKKALGSEECVSRRLNERLHTFFSSSQMDYPDWWLV